MRMRDLFLVIVMAGLTFGGTFNCSDDDDDDALVGNTDSGTPGSGSSLGEGAIDLSQGSSSNDGSFSTGSWFYFD